MVKALSTEAEFPALDNRKRTFIQRMAKKVLLGSLDVIEYGRLSIVDGPEVYSFGEREGTDLDGEILVMDGDFYPSILFGGSIGAGESYMRGEWSSLDLAAVIRVMCRNLSVVDNMEKGLAALGAPLLKVMHYFHRNTRKGSKKNISAHYDLGNDFFESFLDDTMMYSAGVFPRVDATLEEASLYKLERICRKLNLGPDDHVLEIGTGWGGFAIYAAKNFGCRVTTTTISREQLVYAQERVRTAGLEDRIELLFEDYRDLKGSYDKLVSIEMIEAVGHQYLTEYFAKISDLLKPDGQALIQAITIPDDRYDRALKEVDFIKRYIFPGCFIPSIGAMVQAIGKGTDMRLAHLEDQADHYARTLSQWGKKFDANRHKPAIKDFSPSFQRMWEFYFAYCEGAFKERIIGSAQLLFSKPMHRGDHLLHPFEMKSNVALV